MRRITDQELAELRAKYPEPSNELMVLSLRMGDLVIRNPTEAEYGMFISQVSENATKSQAFPNLLTLTCVFPSAAELSAARVRWPGIVRNIRVVSALQYMAGAADELEGKD